MTGGVSPSGGLIVTSLRFRVLHLKSENRSEVPKSDKDTAKDKIHPTIDLFHAWKPSLSHKRHKRGGKSTS